MKILLDTSIIIDFIRQKDKTKTYFYKLALKKENSFHISIITKAELYAGQSVWKNAKARNDLEIILSKISISALTHIISINSGKFKALYGVDLIDGIIAATAITHKLPLATLNRKHFSKIPSLKLLS